MDLHSYVNKLKLKVRHLVDEGEEMKKSILVLIGLMLMASLSYGQIISQYIETNSGTEPKGIEIWNNTGSELNFATNNLVIQQGTNGGVLTDKYTIDTGTLSSGDVLVIGTDNEYHDLKNTTEGNGATFYTYGFEFNGDDAFALKYGGVITDVFGDPGNDPGSEWFGNGVSTKNQNIGLKSGINTGDLDGWTDPSLRFETISTDPVGVGGCDGFGAEDNQTLPVTLSTFTAQYLNSKPTLYWETQSETDNMGWFIYRNTIEDFTSAEEIAGMIPGHGTTTQPQSYIYEDAEELQIEQTYYYWLESVDYGGTIHHYDRVVHITIPDPDDPGQSVTPPIAYDISADPNPFSYTTNISFVMDQPSLVDVAIYNVKGQLVKSFNSVKTSQENETVNFHWYGKDNAGKALSNGVYLYSVKVNGQDYATKQLILMK